MCNTFSSIKFNENHFMPTRTNTRIVTKRHFNPLLPMSEHFANFNSVIAELFYEFRMMNRFFWIDTVISKHLKIFVRDVNNKTLNKFENRDSFNNFFVVLYNKVYSFFGDTFKNLSLLFDLVHFSGIIKL